MLTRLLPRSLAGQMALLIGLALFVAQASNFALILNERQKLSLARTETPAIARFAGLAADIANAPPDLRAAAADEASARGRHLELAAAPPAFARDPAIEARLRAALGDAGVATRGLRGGVGEWTPTEPGGRVLRVLRFGVQLPDGRWLAARMVLPPRDPLLATRLVAATLLLFLVVLGATLWIARRLTRPLGDLRRAAERFTGRGEPEPVPVRGPEDLASALAAFNAMGARLAALLDEKDRMLGAIGHDLRTPLASLRIRLEGIADPAERAAAIASSTELAAILDDILMLARTGRAREEARPTDLAALLDTLAGEYEDAGAAVRFVPGARVVAPVQAVLLRRAIRNLLDNALAYAGSAELSVTDDGGAALVTVRDDGPGIPADALAAVLEPFRRLETSRNRDTGGSGLGLAIARSVAESHGGTLRLANRPEGGLEAVLVLPVAEG